MSKNSQKIKGIIIIAISIVFMVLVSWLVGVPMIKLASEPEKFREWVTDLGFLGQLIFVGMLIFQTFFAVIPGEPFEIVAGYAFGAIEGTILCLIGGLVGSLIIFSFVRTFGKKAVEFFFPIEKINNLRFLRDTKKFGKLAFIVFLIPGTPKDLLVYFLGLTKIDIFTFIIIAGVGRIPSIITSTVGGNALGMQNYVFAIVTFIITVVISALGYIIYQAISNHHNKKQ